ncbi:hypothetical protein L9F63_009240, partial [Diploptera punctata]
VWFHILPKSLTILVQATITFFCTSLYSFILMSALLPTFCMKPSFVFGIFSNEYNNSFYIVCLRWQIASRIQRNHVHVITRGAISELVLCIIHTSRIFSRGNRKKSVGARSGEYAGWGTEPVTSPPFLWPFASHTLPQSLQHLFVVHLIHCLTPWFKFLMHNSINTIFILNRFLPSLKQNLMHVLCSSASTSILQVFLIFTNYLMMIIMIVKFIIPDYIIFTEMRSSSVTSFIILVVTSSKEKLNFNL